MVEMKLVPVRITPEMAHALESNFAVCTDPSEVHAANWQDAWSKALAASPQAPARECAWCDGRKTVQTASTDVTVRCGHCNGTGLEAALTPREEADELTETIERIKALAGEEAPAPSLADPECRGCGGGDKVPADVEYWCCPVCDAEWHGEEAPAEGVGDAFAATKTEIDCLFAHETFFTSAEASELSTDVMEIVSKHFLRARTSEPSPSAISGAALDRDLRGLETNLARTSEPEAGEAWFMDLDAVAGFFGRIIDPDAFGQAKTILSQEFEAMGYGDREQRRARAIRIGREIIDCYPLYRHPDHPAPATADKLRETVTETILSFELATDWPTQKAEDLSTAILATLSPKEEAGE